MFKTIVNSKSIVSVLMDAHLRPGLTCVDMTVGNGYDSLEILNRIGSLGHLYGFDIQPSAIESASHRLKAKGHGNFTFYLRNHSAISEKIEGDVDFAIYNLGYLPGSGNKRITTTSEDTLTSLKALLTQLNPGAMVVITCYPGHPEGAVEYEQLNDYLRTLSQREYAVCQYDFINQRNHPPVVIAIEKDGI